MEASKVPDMALEEKCSDPLSPLSAESIAQLEEMNMYFESIVFEKKQRHLEALAELTKKLKGSRTYPITSGPSSYNIAGAASV